MGDGPVIGSFGPIAWRVIFGVLAAVDVFLLTQTDVPLDPIAKVALGAFAVALAVLNPSDAVKTTT
jgi:hypothetical protein